MLYLSFYNNEVQTEQLKLIFQMKKRWKKYFDNVVDSKQISWN